MFLETTDGVAIPRLRRNRRHRAWHGAVGLDQRRHPATGGDRPFSQAFRSYLDGNAAGTSAPYMRSDSKPTSLNTPIYADKPFEEIDAEL